MRAINTFTFVGRVAATFHPPWAIDNRIIVIEC